jgi:PKD repeat protein
MIGCVAAVNLSGLTIVLPSQNNKFPAVRSATAAAASTITLKLRSNFEGLKFFEAIELCVAAFFSNLAFAALSLAFSALSFSSSWDADFDTAMACLLPNALLDACVNDANV